MGRRYWVASRKKRIVSGANSFEQLAEGAGALRLADLAGLLGVEVAVAGPGVPAADLAHLVGGLHQAVVQPILGHRLAVAAFALGDLVFVVGEDQVQAAAVDVEGAAQQAAAHGRALDVPAGPARAPGARPGGLARLGPLPEGEIGGVALPLGHAAPFALHRLQRAMAELAVVRVLAHVEVNVAVGADRRSPCRSAPG